MKYAISRCSDYPCWEGEIEDSGNSSVNLGRAVIAAHKSGADLRGADLTGAVLTGADLTGAVLRGADLHIGKIKAAKVYTGLYRYICMPIVTEDGTPLVRMGCLWKTVEEWDRIGIRASNTNQYPDDGSETSEERVLAFEFCRSEALRMAEKLREEK